MSPSRLAALALAAALIDLVLIQPNHPGAATPAALRLFPLELPAILAGLAALGPDGRIALGLRRGLAALLLILVVWKIADLASYLAFDRGWDPLTDLHLLPAGIELMLGSFGPLPAALLLFGALAALVAFGALVGWALKAWARVALRGRARGLAAAVAVTFAAISAADIGHLMGAWRLPANPPGAAFTSRLAVENLRDLARSSADFARFAEAARTDPFEGAPGLLAGLGGRDVVILFVESYGRTSFVTPDYAAAHDATRAAAEAALAGAELSARTGWLVSPVVGGQSWLAHATFASGLTITDQRRYRTLLASPRATLFDLAARAGYRTLAVAPAITRAWPEGPRLGFQQVLAAADLGYAGLPFNWVTMPDQFTLAAYERARPAIDGPVMAEIALISSHAPWVPVPDLVPWDAVGDGRVFDAMAQSGDPPEIVWSEPERIRAAFAEALDYALETAFAFAARPRDEPPLIVVLGDHPPAGFVSGIEGREVPVHLIGTEDALALFDGWGWTEGLTPEPGLAPWPMAAFRDRFLAATLGPRGEGGS